MAGPFDTHRDIKEERESNNSKADFITSILENSSGRAKLAGFAFSFGVPVVTYDGLTGNLRGTGKEVYDDLTSLKIESYDRLEEKTTELALETSIMASEYGSESYEVILTNL